MTTTAALVALWRADADVLRRHADERGAFIVESCAAQLECALRDEADELLTLADAARESGYSTRRLRELVASRELPNAGRKHAPRVRRADLPKKGARVTQLGAYRVDDDALSLVGRGANGANER